MRVRGDSLKYLERGGGGESWVKGVGALERRAVETPYELCITSFYFLRIIDNGIE